jgi:uncharacterized protein YndB with AHSA1/START domain
MRSGVRDGSTRGRWPKQRNGLKGIGSFGKNDFKGLMPCLSNSKLRRRKREGSSIELSIRLTVVRIVAEAESCRRAAPSPRLTKDTERNLLNKEESIMNTGTLKVAANGDREIVMTRVLAAPRALVFDAFTKPELVRRWLLGPDGWSMPICEIDLRVGGSYRYVWQRDKDGVRMGMGGVYREIVVPQRIVSTEKFDESWYPGEAVGTLVLVEEGGKTTVTQTVLYESRGARDEVLKSPMESGVAAGYDRLEKLLETL